MVKSDMCLPHIPENFKSTDARMSTPLNPHFTHGLMQPVQPLTCARVFNNIPGKINSKHGIKHMIFVDLDNHRLELPVFNDPQGLEVRWQTYPIFTKLPLEIEKQCCVLGCLIR